jgi:hypothetical protein
MGSFVGGDNHTKGQDPSLSWVQQGIEDWNIKCRRRAQAAPWYLKLLAWLGKPRRYYQWQRDHWYD